MTNLALSLLALAGCSATLLPAGDPAADPAAATCGDAMYGDGTCQLDLACGIPDIDCYAVYPTDQDAAMAVQRATGYATLRTSDPRYARAHALVDRAWDMFRAEVAVDRLAEQRLSVVVMDSGAQNAFVLADPRPGMVMWSIQIYRGLLDTMTDDEVVSVLLHELSHAVRQHVVAGVAESVERFYVTSTPEVLGYRQGDSAPIRALAQAWRRAAILAGPYSSVALQALPLGGDLGLLFEEYVARQPYIVPACADALAALQRIADRASIRPLDGAFEPRSIDPYAYQASYVALTACTPPSLTFRNLVAPLGSAWMNWIGAAIEPSEAAVWERPALEAIFTLVGQRRRAMRTLEARLASEHGVGWSQIRIFTYEEAADDESVHIATRTGEASRLGSAFHAMLGTTAAECDDLLASGRLVPYGVDLTEPHHALCWRIGHAAQVASEPASSARTLVVPPAPWTPTAPQVPRPMF